MTEVFCTRAKTHTAKARVVVRALEQDGYKVFWDKQIGAGDDWPSTVEAEFDAAKGGVVLRSSKQANSLCVLEEAEFARTRGMLCPAVIDAATPPLDVGGVQASSLIGWRGDRKDPAWFHFSASVAARRAGQTRPSTPAHPVVDRG